MKKTETTQPKADFEDFKSARERVDFHEGFAKLMSLNFAKEELVHMFPIFTGDANLARFLSLYELYKRTDNILGHIAEVGVWKGASFMFWAKLVRIFEPRSVTQVHGFEWFKGMNMDTSLDDQRYQGDHQCSLELLQDVIVAQKLENIAMVHDLDVSTQLEQFFKTYPSLQFKIVFLDCGSFSALTQSIQQFWPRLTPGGIMIFDHANLASVAQESVAIRNYFGDGAKLRTLNFSSWPSGYIEKP